MQDSSERRICAARMGRISISRAVIRRKGGMGRYEDEWLDAGGRQACAYHEQCPDGVVDEDGSCC